MSDPLHEAERWLGNHHRAVLVAVVVLSLAVRAAAFAQLSKGPFLSLDHWDQTDMHYYDEWARNVAQGDWWSRSVGVPMHNWQVDVAARCLASGPTDSTAASTSPASPGPAGTTPVPGASPSASAVAGIWARWNGSPTFYEDPLYPYLVAFTYRVVAASPQAVFIWQMGLGIVTNVLIVVVTRRYFGDLAAAIAGLLAVLCAPFVHYELLLLRDSTVVCAGLLLVWLTDRAMRAQGAGWWAVVGVAAGLVGLLKATSLALVVIPAAGAMALEAVGTPGSRVRRASVVALLAGLAVPLACLAVRNGQVGAPLVAIAGNGSVNFAIANNIGYPPTGGLAVVQDAVAGIMCRAGGRLWATVAATLAPHTLGSLAALLWHKFDHVWFWYEVPNNANFYYIALHAPILDWMPVTFRIIAPLGLVGLVLARVAFRRAWPLYALVGWAVASLMAFVVLGRLRAVLMAAMIPFAAVTIVRLARGRHTIRLLVAVGLLALWTGRPLPEGVPRISATDWFTPYWVTYEARVNAAVAASDPAAAARALQEFLGYEPDFSQMSQSDGRLVDAGDRDAALAFAEVHTTCAGFLEKAGQPVRAATERVRSADLRRMAQASPP